jgi:hypothetical protein
MMRHGEKCEQLSEAARVNDSYCKLRVRCTRCCSQIVIPVIHYAEGSLMPTLVFKFLFNMIPEKAPILLRPFLKGIFDALIGRLTLPRLRLHADFVSVRLSLALPSNS